MFAVEVPFQEDLSRHMLLPAAISAAAGYVTFAALAGTEPILPVAGQAPFNLVVAGLLARVLVALVRRAGQLSTPGHPLVRALAAGAVLAGVVVVGHQLSSEPLMLGPGYHALGRVLEPHRSVLAIVALGTLRVVGTTAAVGGGGVGGLFIPLVTQANPTLFSVVGMAAFLGAGYRVPLAAVVFVAEFTGRPGFVVPGLIAAVVAQLVMGQSPSPRTSWPGASGRPTADVLASDVDRHLSTGSACGPRDSTSPAMVQDGGNHFGGG